jgi:AcrR family transcriptional regulator
MRWEPGAADRITDAAIALFRERGFEQTTTTAIAESAGVTRRTFSRYFADKRDVVFGEHSKLPGVVADVIATAPAGSSTPVVLSVALHRLANEVFVDYRDRMRGLHQIIVSNESLREREQHKNALIADAGEQAFLARGFAPLEARLAAQLGVLVLSLAIERWVADDDSDLGDLADEILREIGSMTRAY